MKNTIIVLTVTLLSCKDPIPCSTLEFEDGFTTKNGRNFTGECNTFYHDFKLRSIQRYKNGRDHDKWTFYFNNGNIQTEGLFEKGKRIGEWKYFYESGKVWKINHYKNGLKVGNWQTYSEEGDLIESVQFD